MVRRAQISIRSREEADRAIRQIGELQRQLGRIKLDTDTKVTAILDEAAAKQAEPEELLRQYTQAVARWAEEFREQLTNGGKAATAKMPHGEIRWRTTPRSVTIRNIPAVIKWLKENKLKRFIRLKEEIDKSAILAAPPIVAESIEGITISQEERLIIVPAGTGVEVTQKVSVTSLAN